MNLENYYWYFTKAIPSSICDEIVKTGESFSKEKGLTGGHTDREPPSKELADIAYASLETLEGDKVGA